MKKDKNSQPPAAPAAGRAKDLLRRLEAGEKVDMDEAAQTTMEYVAEAQKALREQQS